MGSQVDADLAIWRKVQPYTMTSLERVSVLVQSVDRIVNLGIPGAIVECGVWKGGSMMAVALRLLELNIDDRELWLYDTFTGMTEPGEYDVDWASNTAESQMVHPHVRAAANMDEVAGHLVSTGYPRFHLVCGDVLDEIPGTLPGPIAILRLDTDWYESTRHELEHLWPLLEVGGVLIVDDYGWWKGSRKAVDEWNATLEHPVELRHIDDIGVYAIKAHA